ncbi:MAG: serine hydrolase, partial [Burkholderiales bacterium]
GLAFKETYQPGDDFSRYVAILDREGTLAALRAFNVREAPEGTKWNYASNLTMIPALLIQAVTGQTVTRYMTERLWQPMGAEADATWIVGTDGLELVGGRFNAVLRDWGRLAILLANDGAIAGRQLVPKEYLVEATDRKLHPFFLQSVDKAGTGYGYLFRTLPGEDRQFASTGIFGQWMLVAPGRKLAMVITSAGRKAIDPALDEEVLAAWHDLVAKYAR